jgi:hypothetical protein
LDSNAALVAVTAAPPQVPEPEEETVAEPLLAASENSRDAEGEELVGEVSTVLAIASVSSVLGTSAATLPATVSGSLYRRDKSSPWLSSLPLILASSGAVITLSSLFYFFRGRIIGVIRHR